MDYQVNIKNKKNGFSIIEIIVVLGIFAVLFSVSSSSFNSFKANSNLQIATGGVVEAIRIAQGSAQSGKMDSKWGAEILSNKVVVFKGASYAGRDPAFDEELNFPGGISASGLSEVVFEKISGTTLNTGTIIITNGSETKNLVINEKGTVTY